MAYNRDETRRPSGRDNYYSREGRSDDPRMGRERYGDRGSMQEDRGFFERAGDEIASWFGDDDAERRHDRDDRYDRGPTGRQSSDYYGRSRSRTAPKAWDDGREARGFMGSRDFDPHYRDWRQRQIDALDRDYDEYRRENQSRFESEFGGWREKRMTKRAMLGQARQHMDVVGSDGEHVGTIDRIAGDRIILTRSDEASGGAHHSLSCADIDRVEDNKVVLECTAEQAQARWRDDTRSRALFEREDQGETGPHILNRSFEGTYR